MKAVVAAFNQEKALGGAFSVIVQLHRLIDLRHYLEPNMSTSISVSCSAAVGEMNCKNDYELVDYLSVSRVLKDSPLQTIFKQSPSPLCCQLMCTLNCQPELSLQN